MSTQRTEGTVAGAAPLSVAHELADRAWYMYYVIGKQEYPYVAFRLYYEWATSYGLTQHSVL